MFFSSHLISTRIDPGLFLHLPGLFLGGLDEFRARRKHVRAERAIIELPGLVIVRIPNEVEDKFFGQLLSLGYSVSLIVGIGFPFQPLVPATSHGQEELVVG